jgi:hypothetical protein
MDVERFMRKSICFALALVAGAAVAQEKRPDPKDPKAKAPPVEYRSAFEGYRRHAEPELAPWRVVNEEVERVGGHVGVMRAGEKEAAKEQRK